MLIPIVQTKWLPCINISYIHSYSQIQSLPYVMVSINILAILYRVLLFVCFCFSFYSLCQYSCRTYTPGDSFVGYHDDTAASVVLQVTKNLSEDGRREYDDEEEVR